MTTTNKTTKTPAPQATETSAPDDDLLALLKFSTTVEGVRVGDELRERQERTETRVQTHASGAEDAALSGEEAQQAHEAEAARLQREITRLDLAITRADARLAEVAERERREAAEREVATAEKELAAGRQDLAEIRAMTEALAARISDYDARCERIWQSNQVLLAGGLTTVPWPHIAESEADQFIEREVFAQESGVRITDAAGRKTLGCDPRGGLLYSSQPEASVERVRRIERQHIRGRKARDPRRAGFVLPDVLDNRLYVLRQD
jgi:D-ribose pyranose/furanose isomerase RbsD